MGTFLLILKIIGITLAVLIGLVLLIVLLILFVPIRYKGNGEYPYTGNKLPADIHGKVTWLLHLIHVSFDTTPEGQIIKLKIFGITFYSNDPETLAKKAEKQKKKQEKMAAKKKKKKAKAAAKKKKEKEQRKKKMEAQKSKNASQKDKEFKKWDKKHKKEVKKASAEKLKERAKGTGSGDSKNKNTAGNDSLGSLDRAYFDTEAADRLKEEKKARELEKEQEKNKSDSSDESERKADDTSQNEDKDIKAEDNKDNKAEDKKDDKAQKTSPRPGSVEYLRQHTGVSEEKKKSEIYEEHVKIFDDEDSDDEDSDGNVNSSGASDEDSEGDTEKKSFAEKILGKLKSIVKIPQKIYNKIAGLYRKYRKYKDFIDDSRVRKAVSYIWKKVKLVLKRVLPRKLEGNAVIGMNDPSTTGFILAGASLFYRRWAGHFKIEPDFSQKRIEGKGSFKGRIQIIGIVIPALKVWLNKDVKHLRERLDNLKEKDDETDEKKDDFEEDKD